MRREEIAIDLPCSADWDTMTAEGKKRFCADCKKFVHDLSRMKETEAKALLDSFATSASRTVDSGSNASSLCVRYVYDELGNVVFDIDQKVVRASALVRAKRFASSVRAAALVALPMSLTACMGAAVRPAPVPVAAPTASASATPASTPVAK
jgi:hypothetical protein